MKSVVGLRFWIALALGVAVAAVAHAWPASPRAVVRHDHIGWHLAFSRDGTKLALLDREAGLNPQGQVLVWDAATGRLRHRFDTEDRPYPSKVVFAPDDRSLGVIDAGPVTRWDLATGHIIAHHDHAAWSHDADHYSGREILFSSAGRWLAHDVHDGRVYDVETGRVVVDYAERWPDRSLHAHNGRVAALVDGEVKTFDVLTGDAVGTFPSGANRPPMARTAFTFSPDGTRGVLFTDRWVLADGVDGRRLALDGSLDGMADCRLSGDNRFLAVALVNRPRGVFDAVLMRLHDTRRYVHVFDAATGADIGQPFRGGRMSCFAPDGRTLAVAHTNKSIALWDWPPPSRWPRTLALAASTTMLSYGIGVWWSRGRLWKAIAK